MFVYNVNMTDYDVSQGSLTDGVLVIPKKVDVVDGNVVYQWRDVVERRVSPLIVDDFIALAESWSEDHLLIFIRRYGVLHLCEHGLPMFHNRRRSEKLLPGECTEQRSLSPGWDYQEPIHIWRRYAAEGRGLLLMAQSLQAGRMPSAEVLDSAMPLFSVLLEHHQQEGVFGRRPDPQEDCSRLLAMLLNEWIDIGGVRPYFSIGATGWRVRLSAGHYATTFGAIAVRLALLAAGAQGLSVCSNPDCRREYLHGRRRPDPNRNNYCPECRKAGIPQRDASWRYRAKKRF